MAESKHKIEAEVGVKGAEEAAAKLNYVQKVAKSFASEVTSKLTGLFAAAAVGKMAFDKIGEAINKNISEAKQIGKLSAQFHIDPQQTHSLMIAANAAGVSVRSLMMGMKQMGAEATKALAAPAKADLFKQIGIDAEKLGKVSAKPIEHLGEIAQGLMRIDNETDRTVVGTKLLGRQYQQMLPLIQELGTSEKARAEFLKNGNAMTAEQVQIQKEMAKAQDNLNDSFNRFVANLAPALEWGMAFVEITFEIAKHLFSAAESAAKIKMEKDQGGGNTSHKIAAVRQNYLERMKAGKLDPEELTKITEQKGNTMEEKLNNYVANQIELIRNGFASAQNADLGFREKMGHDAMNFLMAERLHKKTGDKTLTVGEKTIQLLRSGDPKAGEKLTEQTKSLDDKAQVSAGQYYDMATGTAKRWERIMGTLTAGAWGNKKAETEKDGAGPSIRIKMSEADKKYKKDLDRAKELRRRQERHSRTGLEGVELAEDQLDKAREEKSDYEEKEDTGLNAIQDKLKVAQDEYAEADAGLVKADTGKYATLKDKEEAIAKAMSSFREKEAALRQATIAMETAMGNAAKLQSAVVGAEMALAKAKEAEYAKELKRQSDLHKDGLDYENEMRDLKYKNMQLDGKNAKEIAEEKFKDETDLLAKLREEESNYETEVANRIDSEGGEETDTEKAHKKDLRERVDAQRKKAEGALYGLDIKNSGGYVSEMGKIGGGKAFGYGNDNPVNEIRKSNRYLEIIAKNTSADGTTYSPAPALATFTDDRTPSNAAPTHPGLIPSRPDYIPSDDMSPLPVNLNR